MHPIGVDLDDDAQRGMELFAAQLAYPERIASRLGERIRLPEVARITHCFARDRAAELKQRIGA
jgi:hypothetical protein